MQNKDKDEADKVKYNVNESKTNSEIYIICPKCGTKIELEGWNCPFCNSFNTFDSFFCKKCGKRIKKPDGTFIQKYSEIKVGLDDKRKMVYSIKIWGKNKFKFNDQDKKNEEENIEKLSFDKFRHWKISEGRCEKCFAKIPERLKKLMEKGYKVRCEVCDNPLN
ncbi:MAG: hypothetical protein ACTSQO_02890 [Candidatus Helarchaeota archaeon]